MTLRDRLPELGVAAVALYAGGRLAGVIGGDGDSADPVSQGGPSGGDRNTTGSDNRPQITPRAPGLEQLLERQRDRQRSTVPTTGGTTGGSTVEETTAASDTTDTDPTGGGDTRTTGTADTTAGGDDRNAVGEPGNLDGDGSTVADLFAGGLSSSPSGDRNVTGDPGSTTATDDRNTTGGSTQRPDMNTAPDPTTTSQTQRPDEPQDTASGGGQLGGFDPADPTDEDDDRGGGGSDSTSASEDDSGGSSVADSFSGGLSSGIAGDN